MPAWPRRRSGRRWRGCWRGQRRRSRRRRRSWSARQHSDIRATKELLDIGVESRTPTRAAVEIPMESIVIPPLLCDLVPVAAIILLPDRAVCDPPMPLQFAARATEIAWNNVTEFVSLGQAPSRWQVEALWVQAVNRLAICSGIVRNAIRRGLCTN